MTGETGASAAARRDATTLLVLGAIVIVAAALRLWHLGGRPLWFDETWSVLIARQPLEDIPGLVWRHDTIPPLYYLALNLWIGLFGEGEVAVRLPSVLASLAVVGGTFFLGRRVAGPHVGLLAAALLALSPFQVTAAQEARTYPFITLFGLAAGYGLWRALEQGRRRHWVLYAGGLALGLYTHHFSWLLVPAFAMFVLATPQTRAAWKPWVFWTAAAGVAYLPMVPFLFVQLFTARGWPEIRPAFDLLFLTDLLGLFDFGGQVLGMGTYYHHGTLPLASRPAILLPFLLLTVAGVAALRETRRRAFLFSYWCVPVVLAAAISLEWRLFFARYFSFVLPPFAIMVAAGVLMLAGAARPTFRTAAAAGLAAYLLVFTLPSLSAVYSATPAYDWRGAGKHVAAMAQAGDFILYVPAFTRIPFEYYFQGTQPRMGLNPDEVPRGEQRRGEGGPALRVAVDPQRAAALAREHPRLWVVTSTGLATDMRAQIAAGLHPFFRRSEERMFGLVAVSLWESRTHAGAGRR